RDERTCLQRFTPRRARSPWSKRNTTLAERLISEGRMQASGIAEVDRAKADGRWEAAYAGPATARVPDDLAAALAAEPKAKTMFRRLTSRNRYAILHRIEAVKRPGDSCPQDRGVRGDARARRDGTSADAEEQRPTMIGDQRERSQRSLRGEIVEVSGHRGWEIES